MPGKKPSSGRGFYIGCAILALVLYPAYFYPMHWRALEGKNDFLQLYCGARLVGTSDLYSVEACKQIHLAVVGTWFPSINYTRLPYYALLLKPLGSLPYLAAYSVFQAFSIALTGAWLLYFSARSREFALIAAMSLPAVVNFGNGQDAGIVAALAAFAWVLMRQGRDFTAGLVLALCSLKFHLFVLVPLALLLRRRWRVLQGGVTGGVILAVLSFAAGGLNWPAEFLTMVRNPALHPGGEWMPSLRGLTTVVFGENLRIELALSAAAVACFAWIAHRTPSFDLVYGLALACGLLIAHHAYLQDTLLVLAALGIWLQAGVWKRLPAVAAIAALPPAGFMVLHGPPWSMILPALMITLLLVAAYDDFARRARPGNQAS